MNVWCPSCGAEQPPTNPNQDFSRCIEQDCGVPFIEDPQVEVLDDTLLAAASALARGRY